MKGDLGKGKKKRDFNPEATDHSFSGEEEEGAVKK